MDEKQAQAFLAVARLRSFSAAAQSLSLTLAAVSMRIRALETRLGQALLIRGKQVVLTRAGQALLAHLMRVKAMEADLLADLQASEAQPAQWRSLVVAVNGDSLSSWFMPAVEATLQRYRILLDIIMEDQDHTLALLKAGEVSGCVTALSRPLRGCVAVPLGRARYRCVASAANVALLRGNAGKVTRGRLAQLPAIIFNRKDGLQDAFLRQQFGSRPIDYPRHFVPSTEAYERAIERGWGWGMVSEPQLALRCNHQPELVDVIDGAFLDVALYWHHWEYEPPTSQRLTRAVIEAARCTLLQP
ncbi:chromosome replication initiation inhibitor protein [Lampropedia cohaerens]|uniref:Chromosome replication initiation inhibitor protein n=1 Tax=Lampropedia cohaerens TaxID=1610491 RepID=A0A0U1Q259_9BURK|nr:HTH-type transcriptional regulator ArgP [Lampropedia cohaerens]KKW68675.1 chromosome replication initiation inhibitor protein [Lampropedia cohaerens]